MSEPANIAAFLPVMSRTQPHTLAILYPEGRTPAGRVRYSHFTFQQLDRESDIIARGLELHGIGRGVRTVLMVKPSLEFFALTFALFKVGAVPVLVDPGIGRKNLGTCLAESEPTAFIGIPKAHMGRVMFGWARKTLKTLVTVGRRGPWGGVTLEDVRRLGASGGDFSMANTTASETAAILFTSGSTGVPKGVVYNHGNFIAQVNSIRETYGIEPGEIDLPTFAPFALFDPALGMTTVIPDMDFANPGRVDPRKLVEAIEDFGVTNVFGSPAVINKLGRYGVEHGVKLPTLRRVLSAGAPMSPDILERFTTMLSPGVQIFTPYGATEALPVASVGSADLLLAETRALTAKGDGICVGHPVATSEVEIVGITDAPIGSWSEAKRLPVGEIGEIVVRGPTVTREYFNRARATELAKIVDTDESVAHRMGDLGYFDAQGRLWYCGRKSHRVTTKTGTLFTDPCENVFNVHPDVFRTALVGVTRNGAVEPVLCVELEATSRNADREKVRSELLALGAAQAQTAEIKELLFHPSFPVDIRHNAKIFREKLAVWAQKELG